MEGKRIVLIFAGLLVVVSIVSFFYEPRTISDVVEKKAGKEIFDQHCSACHGADGHGTPLAQSLRNRGLTEPYIATMIQTGNTVMPKFTHMSDSALASIVSYVLDMQ